jgi:hypothetical protein
MTKLLGEAVEQLRALPEDEQDRAACAFIAYVHERHEVDVDSDATWPSSG